jgi:SAM-dependent methyltransferase
VAASSNPGLLGDTPDRDYASKLQRFNAFAGPELRRLIGSLGLRPGMRVVDAGCGTGEALPWLLAAVQPGGCVIGIDLAAAHVAAARRFTGADIEVIQDDLSSSELIAPASVDFIWCVNTINHLREPVTGLVRLKSWLRPNGRIALGQSSLLPDMYFAWDSRLERVTNEAVRRYYRERYSLDERDLAPVRAIAGVLRAAGLRNVTARSVLIERLHPLDAATERYLTEAIFRETWGPRLQPYLSDHDYRELACLCDPLDDQFALRRPDFHFLQTFTLAIGEV